MLENKVIIITGSSQGIGRAIAEECHAQGAKVIIHSHDQKASDEVAEKLGKNAVAIGYDLRAQDCGQKIVDFAIKNFGRLDGLVNNAGIYPRSTVYDDINAQFDLMFHINVRAPMLLMQSAVIQFEKQENKGSIVNIGSLNAHCGLPRLFVYSGSKGALMTTTRNLANALAGSDIRVNQLNLGWVLTEGEIVMQRSEGQPENWFLDPPRNASPRGQLLSPKDIANHAAFWLSDKCGPITGQCYEVEQFPVIGRLL